jgi:2-polyprenyl-3-methyl-5-hydroxy-6-metoxy-1,4-benzoquinol methylase
MQIHYEVLGDVSRYLEVRKHVRLEDKEEQFNSYLRCVSRFKAIDFSSRMLEIGTGLGWFPLLCQMKGLSCKGLEISPALIEHAKELGRSYGLTPDIELGNIEETDLGESKYDVIIAASVFEHVEYWQPALKKVARALKPGGVLFFESTNKFGLTSGEFWFPLYGWFPDSLRFRMRTIFQGDDIMKLGIDFNQFTYPQLSNAFKTAGFSAVIDRLELADVLQMPPLKRLPLTLAKRFRLLGWPILTFSQNTIFVCVK